MNASGDPGWLATSIPLSSGEHEYAVIEDGQWLVDPTVPTSGFYDGIRRSPGSRSPIAAVPGLEVTNAAGSTNGQATIEATFLASTSRDPLDPSSLRVTATDGSIVHPSATSRRTPPAGRSPSPSRAWLRASTRCRSRRTTRRAGAPRIPRGPRSGSSRTPFDTRDLVLYQVMVDRYRGPNGALRSRQPSVPSARAGGTLSGVRAAIASGDFARRSASTRSGSRRSTPTPTAGFPAPMAAPTRATTATGPKTRAPPRATMASRVRRRRARRRAPHARGMRVLFDVVPNHVHEEHSVRASAPERRLVQRSRAARASAAPPRATGRRTSRTAGSPVTSPISTGRTPSSPTRSPATFSGGSTASTATTSASTPCP